VQLPEIHKVFLNVATLIAWGLGIFISFFAVTKGRKMKEELGVSFKTYLILVGTTEIFYIIGAAMILSAMGMNVLRHLANLEFWKFYEIINRFDWTTFEIIGIIGWIGFLINRLVSFLSPGYLLIYGGKRLPKYFYYSACMEIGLETVLTLLIFVTLLAG
jgi:hypothetical protein